jgi:hypothetical protein
MGFVRPKVLKGERPRESRLAGAGKTGRFRSKTPKQDQVLREAAVVWSYRAFAAPAGITLKPRVKPTAGGGRATRIARYVPEGNSERAVNCMGGRRQ